MSKKPSKFWTYDPDTGILCQQVLNPRTVYQESWYEDMDGNAYEPFYVDTNKKALYDRAYNILYREYTDAESKIATLRNKLAVLKISK